MIKEKDIKVGQIFKGQIDNSFIKIVDIYKPIIHRSFNSYVSKITYVKIENLNAKNENYKYGETNLETFKHLLFEKVGE